MSQHTPESPEDYAQRRANETRSTYLITGMGHVVMNSRINRKLAAELGGVRMTVKPRARTAIARAEGAS